MSYCRFGEGDVYMYPTKGGIECCSCQLRTGAELVVLEDATAALAHLVCHRAAGHDVPQHALERLIEESTS
jgi:hypothetical protein